MVQSRKQCSRESREGEDEETGRRVGNRGIDSLFVLSSTTRSTVVETDREIPWKGASSPSTTTILRVHRAKSLPTTFPFSKVVGGSPGLAYFSLLSALEERQFSKFILEEGFIGNIRETYFPVSSYGSKVNFLEVGRQTQDANGSRISDQDPCLPTSLINASAPFRDRG